MRLTRADIGPLLTIVAGAVIGGSLSFSLLASSSSGDVRAPGPSVAPSASAEEAVSSGQASAFDLHQNYPNPFNPQTTIPFVLDEGLFAEGRPTLVSIRIFDALEQLVASPIALDHPSREGAELLELEYTQPGTYEAFWDGTDQSGRQVTSGVYFLQLNVNAMRKMVRLFKRS